MIEIHHGDCIDIMRTLPDNSVDSIVTDPPYGLGFMGKAWDALPPGEDWARECLRVLKPGGHLLAFGGTRTWHRLAVAVEDAGFDIRDSIAWMYGSGFPKSHDVSKAIDKAAGAEPIVLGVDHERARRNPSGKGGTMRLHGFTTLEEAEAAAARGDKCPDGRDAAATVANYHASAARLATLTAPATPAAQQWQGWGTALKPAFEPIVMARKPLIGTVAANVQTHGTGALNIDGCRIRGAMGPDRSLGKPRRDDNDIFGKANATINPQNPAGRWPANVALDEHMAAVLDGQSGVSRSKAHDRGKPGGTFRLDGCSSVEELRALAASGRQTPTGRDAATSLARYEGQAVEVTGPTDEGGASRFMYVAKAPKKERPVVDGVAHATVKPLALMRWLVRLVTPVGGTVLEPFAGSGTTVEACILEGFHCIAIEREAEYLPLIQARIDRQDAA